MPDDRESAGWQSESQGEPDHRTAAQRQLAELAVLYHERCENHDRLVCTGPVLHGVVMPATSAEQREMSKHATALRRSMFDLDVSRLDVSWGEWQKAIMRAGDDLARETLRRQRDAAAEQ